MCGGGSKSAQKPVPPPTTNMEPVPATKGTREQRMRQKLSNHPDPFSATLLTGASGGQQ